jgi:hypothetical protein
MSTELHDCAEYGNLERVKDLVEGGTYMEETDSVGMTALSLASLHGHFDIVTYLVEHNANVVHTASEGIIAHYLACVNGNLSSVKYLLEHGARITEKDDKGMTGLLYATESENLEVIQYLLSSEGGASITETANEGNTALLLAAGGDNRCCCPPIVQWLLEYGRAQITDTNNDGDSVWTFNCRDSLPNLLMNAYRKKGDGTPVSMDVEYAAEGDTVALFSMLRVMVLHGGPSESLVKHCAPPFQRIMQDGARLRARLPAYLAQRRALLDAHCPLLPPLQALVHGYEEITTTDELWATGLGAPSQRVKRSIPESGLSPERRSARMRQKSL